MKKLILCAFAAVLFSCSSDENSNDNDNAPESGAAYMKGKMDNTTFDYTVNNNSSDTFAYSAASGYGALDLERWYYYAGVITNFNPPTLAPQMIIGWDNMFYGPNGNEAEETAAFYDTVATLPTNFLTAAQDDAHMQGLTIDFKAADGTHYSTMNGSQTGSSITVDGSTQGSTAVGAQKTKTVWGTFTCKLYNDDDPTDVIVVTDGKFKIILSEYM
ncbi:MAG TPA: hypothetical protein VGB44_11155 [Flavobacterium sp.]|jgi:hypothetical protein